MLHLLAMLDFTTAFVTAFYQLQENAATAEELLGNAMSNASPGQSINSANDATEPDAHGQAALLLAESILHALVEGKVLSRVEAIAVVHTASEVKVEVALAEKETSDRMLASLGLLSRIARSFALYDADR